MCLIEIADKVDFARVNLRIARKEHRCIECRRTILCGERYEYAFTILDRERSVYKTCQHCLWARKWLDEYCGGWVWTGLEEDLHEHIHEYPNWRLMKRVCGIRKKWTNRHGYLFSLKYNDI